MIFNGLLISCHCFHYSVKKNIESSKILNVSELYFDKQNVVLIVWKTANPLSNYIWLEISSKNRSLA